MSMEIIPAILTSSRREAEQQLIKIRDTRQYERVQIDFVDGEFAANKTIRPEEINILPYFHILFDAHLMVTQNNIKEWSRTAEKVGFDRIIAQFESISEPERFTGLAMDVHSPVEAIEPYLYKLDVVIVMAVEPGFGGAEFINAAVEHVKKLARDRKMNSHHYKICVDGGVEVIHLPFLREWGADEVAVGAERVLSW
jgi:ribulose-phosphate 3-epimerase